MPWLRRATWRPYRFGAERVHRKAILLGSCSRHLGLIPTAPGPVHRALRLIPGAPDPIPRASEVIPTALRLPPGALDTCAGTLGSLPCRAPGQIHGAPGLMAKAPEPPS